MAVRKWEVQGFLMYALCPSFDLIKVICIFSMQWLGLSSGLKK
jgi:hypothetical protein